MKRMNVQLRGGTRVDYHEMGNGVNTLLMLHGNSMDKESFQFQMTSSLADKFRLLSVDFPGHGGTVSAVPPQDAYTVEALADFVVELVREMDLSDFAIFGHSLGGHIAIEAAPRLPGLRGLLTLGTPPLSHEDVGYSPFLDHPALPLIFAEELDSNETMLLAKTYLGDLFDHHADQIQNSILNTDPQFRSVIGADVASGNFQDEASILNNLPFPAAVSVGEEDPLVNRDYMDQVLDSSKMWNDHVQVIEEAGHSSHMEKSESFNSLLEAYLEEMF
ncbi:MAG: alpha/beta hydrolase [Balneolaceae bacterium]